MKKKTWTATELNALYQIIINLKVKYDMQVMNTTILLEETNKNKLLNTRSDKSIVRAMQRLSNASNMVEWPTDSSKSMMKYYDAVGISSAIVSQHIAVNKQLKVSAATMKKSNRSAGEHVQLTSGRFPSSDAAFDNTMRIKTYFATMLKTINIEMDLLNNEERKDVELFISKYK